MPVTFAPADPFSEKISENYGRTEEFNKTLPVVAGLYESNQRAQQAAGDQATHAAIASAQNRTQSYLSDSHLAAQQDFQARSIQAQQEHQQSQQFFEWALQGQKVSQGEVVRMQQQQQGLAEIAHQVSAGNLSPDEAAEMVLQLKTGISRTRQRLEQQHAEEFKAQADLKRKALSLEVQNAEDAKAFQLHAAQLGHTLGVVTDPTTGNMHWLGINDKTGELYNPATAGKHGGQPEQAAGEWSHFADKTGQFDATAAYKDAEARAKGDPDLVDKDTGKINQKGREWMKARMEGVEREFYKAKGGTPPTEKPAEGPKVDELANVAKAVTQRPDLPEPVKRQFAGAVDALKAITSQYPNPSDAPPEVQQQAKQLWQVVNSVPPPAAAAANRTRAERDRGFVGARVQPGASRPVDGAPDVILERAREMKRRGLLGGVVDQIQ